MPGLKIVIGPPPAVLSPAPAVFPLSEVERRLQPVVSAPGIDIRLDVPEHYPSYLSANEQFLLCVEGLAYDRADADWLRLAATLCERIDAGAPVDDTVLEFLRHADGEFLAVVVHKATRTVLAFNDRWARLPLYAARTPSQLVVSREPAEVLPHLSSIRIDRESLVEWLALEYGLRDEWLVTGVVRVPPATLIRATPTETAVRVERRVLEVHDLTASEPIDDCQEAARRYVDLYLAGYASRARTLAECGYRLTSDLSGGFDSRLVLAGARRLDLPMEFYTDDLVTGDESAVALRVAEVSGGRATRVPRPEFVRQAAEWRRWVYLSGGRVNCQTMMGALLVTQARAAVVQDKAARFMGFAGEPIRQPPLPAGGYGGFTAALTADVYTRYVGFEDSCRLLGLDWAAYRHRLAETVALWPEQTSADRCRRFDRLRDLGVVHAGEDRHRWHFWTVTPMWSSYLLDFGYRSIGPRLTNLAFFTELLRQVYPKVLEVPIHGKPMPLTSRPKMQRRSAALEGRARLRQHRWVRWLRRRLAEREKWAQQPSAEERSWIHEYAQAAFRESPAVRATFVEAATMGYLESQPAAHRLYQVLTALWFVAEVDGRFPDRVSEPLRA